MTDALDSFGVQLQRGDGEIVESFFTIAEMTNINPPMVVADDVEVTAHDGVGFKEYIMTLRDLDSFTISINYDPAAAGHVQLITDVVAKTLINWKLIFPDTAVTTWEFAAFVKSFKPNAMPAQGGGAALTAEITFRPSNDAVPVLA